MRKGYVKVTAILAAMALMLSGCGTAYPELTAEEEVKVAEYAAKLLLKYDANNRSRLIVREEAEIEVEEPEELPEEPEDVVEEPEVSEPADTPVIELEQEANTNMIGSPEEFYQLADGIVINYQGLEVCDSYPTEGADAYFALDAATGKHLIVMKFGIENHSQAEQHVDILAQDVILQITANGSYTRNILTTMLTDDMSSYIGDIPAGEAVDVVLLAEADDDVADSISTLMLHLKNDSQKCTIQLK